MLQENVLMLLSPSGAPALTLGLAHFKTAKPVLLSQLCSDAEPRAARSQQTNWMSDQDAWANQIKVC